MKRVKRKLVHEIELERDRTYEYLLVVLANRRWTEQVLAVRTRTGGATWGLRNRIVSLDEEALRVRGRIDELDRWAKRRLGSAGR